MARILVVEPVAQAGLDVLTTAHETDVRLNLPRPELLALLADGGGYDALVVRSQTRVDAELLSAAAPRLSVIGVASVGIDRIDLDAATRAGVMVVNAPTGNTIAAAEHTLALMLAMLRRVPAADASIRGGEWERTALIGAEARGRTLGIIGLGKIGRLVARRALAFEMKVLAYDPYLTAEQASEVGARLVGLPELLRADVITVHTPLTPQTRGMIGVAQLDAMKRGVYLLNVARGGIFDEAALARALASGQVAGAALDVFSAEPMPADSALRDAPNTVLTPHLGASTHEAQARVGHEMAEQVVMALAGITPPYAVNAPAVAADVAPRLRPYVELSRRLAILARQLSAAPIRTIGLIYAGEIAAWDPSPLRTAALAGLLEAVTDQRVNAVNADLVARERGLTVTETRTTESEPWSSLVTLAVGDGPEAPLSVRLAGSTAHGRPHLASLDGFELDAELAGTVLITRHEDRPGVVGSVGTILAEAGVNISSLELSRLSEAGEAMMFVSVDQAVGPETLERLRAHDAIVEARVVQLPRL
jgi:D-3-phosphoglycerate dehydrogenase / 2-oxoglutarate reductase